MELKNLKHALKVFSEEIKEAKESQQIIEAKLKEEHASQDTALQLKQFQPELKQTTHQ